MHCAENKRVIALVSPVWLGHIPAYHRLIAQRLASLGFRVLHLSPEQETFAEWRRFGIGGDSPVYPQGRAADVRAHVRRWLDTIGVPAMRRARRNWNNLAGELARLPVRPDLVLIVFLGNAFLAPWVSARWVDRRIRQSWCGIWNCPPPDGRGIRLRVSGPLTSRACVGILAPDAGIARDIARQVPGTATWAIPEVADLRLAHEVSDEILALRATAAGRPIIALLGNMHRRKGIFTFIEMARRAWSRGSGLYFLAAGDHSPESSGADYRAIAGAAAAAPPNFRLIGRRIGDGAEFNAFVQESDLLFCGYWDFPFNSNILTKAAAFRKSVIVSEGGLMARVTREYGLGAVVSQDDADAALESAVRLLAGVDADKARFSDYAALNDVARLDSVLMDLIGRARSDVVGAKGGNAGHP